jgi:hypothetical protein
MKIVIRPLMVKPELDAKRAYGCKLATTCVARGDVSAKGVD